MKINQTKEKLLLESRNESHCCSASSQSETQLLMTHQLPGEAVWCWTAAERRSSDAPCWFIKEPSVQSHQTKHERLKTAGRKIWWLFSDLSVMFQTSACHEQFIKKWSWNVFLLHMKLLFFLLSVSCWKSLIRIKVWSRFRNRNKV